jgi:hypothetical protein
MRESSGRNVKLPTLEWARSVLDPNTEKIRGSSKHRYLYPLDAAMRAQIEPLRKPYPKRASEASSDAPPAQGGEDGAAPILTLQSETQR